MIGVQLMMLICNYCCDVAAAACCVRAMNALLVERHQLDSDPPRDT
jgi:hypothetical protein